MSSDDSAEDNAGLRERTYLLFLSKVLLGVGLRKKRERNRRGEENERVSRVRPACRASLVPLESFLFVIGERSDRLTTSAAA